MSVAVPVPVTTADIIAWYRLHNSAGKRESKDDIFQMVTMQAVEETSVSCRSDQKAMLVLYAVARTVAISRLVKGHSA